MNWELEVKRIVEYINEYVSQAEADGVVLGLSGGLDSAVVMMLSTMALGKFRVTPIHLPYGKKDRRIIIYGKVICGDCFDKDIKPVVDSIAVERCFSELARGNVMARIRMTWLYLVANDNNNLVIGTTNKSEFEVGYFTKYGDGGVDFEPIGHLYKTEVFELARYLGIPDWIIDKTPTAGLVEGQTDEGDLGMTYEVLDETLKWIVPGNDRDVPSVAPEKKHLARVVSLKAKSNHKKKIPPKLERVYYDN